MTRSSLLLSVLLATVALAGGGCMGDPTREILLPGRLKGAKVTADGEQARVKQGLAAEVPLRAGTQVVRVETGKRPALVQQTRIFVNDAEADRAGENVILATIDQRVGFRSVIFFPDDALADLGHDFEPPVAGEGVILLSSQPDTAFAIDGKPASALKNRPGKQYTSYVTRPEVLRLAPGKHMVELTKRGFRPFRREVEVVKGEYRLIGASLASEAAAATAEGGKT